MSHTKTHIARAVSVMSLLLGLLAVGGTLLSTPAVAKPAKATAPAAVDCKNYKGTFVITTDNPNPEDGTTIHILGSGFPPNTSVPLFADGKPIGTVVTDSTGHFSFPYTIPADAADGSTITFMANCGSVKPVTTVEVSASGDRHHRRAGQHPAAAPHRFGLHPAAARSGRRLRGDRWPHRAQHAQAEPARRPRRLIRNQT